MASHTVTSKPRGPRYANWTADENNCLVQLVSERVNVVESKRNDFETVFNKSSAWEEISKKLHAQMMMILYFLRIGQNVYLSLKSWD